MRTIQKKRIIGTCLALSLLSLTLSQGAIAQKSDRVVDWPGPIADWLDHARQDCPGGFRSDGAVQAVSLTGDGRNGYIIDPHRLVCASSPTLYGGLGPASIELFVTLPTGKIVHSSGILALGYRVVPGLDGGAPVIAFDTHEIKERAGSVDNYRWDGTNFTMTGKRSMALPPMDERSEDK